MTMREMKDRDLHSTIACHFAHSDEYDPPTAIFLALDPIKKKYR